MTANPANEALTLGIGGLVRGFLKNEGTVSIGSKTTAAYERGDQCDKRVQLMADWAAYIEADGS
jgi:hypothetical protein